MASVSRSSNLVCHELSRRNNTHVGGFVYKMYRSSMSKNSANRQLISCIYDSEKERLTSWINHDA